MKNGKIELFDDVMTFDGYNGKYIFKDECGDLMVSHDGVINWFKESELTYLPKQPVMVYVSDESEEDAIKQRIERELLIDFAGRFPDNYRYIVTKNDCSGWVGYNYAIPIDSIKLTITRAELQAIQDTIEKVKNGAILVEEE